MVLGFWEIYQALGSPVLQWGEEQAWGMDSQSQEQWQHLSRSMEARVLRRPVAAHTDRCSEGLRQVPVRENPAQTKAKGE